MNTFKANVRVRLARSRRLHKKSRSTVLNTPRAQTAS
jgi:hypothetical protein